MRILPRNVQEQPLRNGRLHCSVIVNGLHGMCCEEVRTVRSSVQVYCRLVVQEQINLVSVVAIWHVLREMVFSTFDCTTSSKLRTSAHIWKVGWEFSACSAGTS